MTKDNRVQLPSSMGGLMRYDDGNKSSIKIKPEVVVALCVLVMIAVVGLHFIR